MVCSGTATLEAALCRCPLVVIYKLPKIAEVEAKIVRFKMPEFIALPNILLQRRVVPELIQRNATPKNLRAELDRIISDSDVRETQLDAFNDLEQMLGSSDAITRTAQLALRLITGSSFNDITSG